MGEIVETGADGFTVICADGRMKILCLQPPHGPKIAAGDFARQAKVMPGKRFS